jgi:hypothetical protein
VVKLDNEVREMHSLLVPLIAERVNTTAGPKQILIETGASVYAATTAGALVALDPKTRIPAGVYLVARGVPVQDAQPDCRRDEGWAHSCTGCRVARYAFIQNSR